MPSDRRFYIGSNVIDWPLQAMRGLEDGHEICIHTWSHQYMTSFSNEVAFAELYYTRKIIKDILGVTPKCWRPPFGDVDNRIRVIAEGLNLTTIVWNEDSDDWRIGTNNVTAADIDANYERFIQQAQNGTWATNGPVILNHELSALSPSLPLDPSDPRQLHHERDGQVLQSDQVRLQGRCPHPGRLQHHQPIRRDQLHLPRLCLLHQRQHQRLVHLRLL